MLKMFIDKVLDFCNQIWSRDYNYVTHLFYYNCLVPILCYKAGRGMTSSGKALWYIRNELRDTLCTSVAFQEAFRQPVHKVDSDSWPSLLADMDDMGDMTEGVVRSMTGSGPRVVEPTGDAFATCLGLQEAKQFLLKDLRCTGTTQAAICRLAVRCE